ncbi:hypothetical protein GGTG_13634 [Gaeumannomyces tritici R3-111a-1]|uniref:Uncharacterized protein n=1 Tax=Gaeumannomyces tritici (strain R3-111a-1) TaxID=644352 RepID=J3PJF3_GAET3|nr:hypothetical protein GGTG_13634 [Gaeumannomyces tritici R3-111a-1]EJT68804.1 hypothetical protein GGTG_13634 [Gaeumannomyces tritici R3-111a-1]
MRRSPVVQSFRCSPARLERRSRRVDKGSKFYQSFRAAMAAAAPAGFRFGWTGSPKLKTVVTRDPAEMTRRNEPTGRANRALARVAAGSVGWEASSSGSQSRATKSRVGVCENVFVFWCVDGCLLLLSTKEIKDGRGRGRQTSSMYSTSKPDDPPPVSPSSTDESQHPSTRDGPGRGVGKGPLPPHAWEKAGVWSRRPSRSLAEAAEHFPWSRSSAPVPASDPAHWTPPQHHAFFELSCPRARNQCIAEKGNKPPTTFCTVHKKIKSKRRKLN